MPCCLLAQALCQSQTGIQILLQWWWVTPPVGVSDTPVVRASYARLWQAMPLLMTCSWFTRRSSSSPIKTWWPFGSSWQPCGLEGSASSFGPSGCCARWSSTCLRPWCPSLTSRLVMGPCVRRIVCTQAGCARCEAGRGGYQFPFWGRGHGGRTPGSGREIFSRPLEQHPLQSTCTICSLPSRVGSYTRPSITAFWTARVPAYLQCFMPGAERRGFEDGIARAQRCLQMWLAWAVNPESSHVPGACAACGNRAEFHCRVCNEPLVDVVVEPDPIVVPRPKKRPKSSPKALERRAGASSEEAGSGSAAEARFALTVAALSNKLPTRQTVRHFPKADLQVCCMAESPEQRQCWMSWVPISFRDEMRRRAMWPIALHCVAGGHRGATVAALMHSLISGQPFGESVQHISGLRDVQIEKVLRESGVRGMSERHPSHGPDRSDVPRPQGYIATSRSNMHVDAGGGVPLCRHCQGE